jgi:hypothetical protein
MSLILVAIAGEFVVVEGEHRLSLTKAVDGRKMWGKMIFPKPLRKLCGVARDRSHRKVRGAGGNHFPKSFLKIKLQPGDGCATRRS